LADLLYLAWQPFYGSLDDSRSSSAVNYMPWAWVRARPISESRL